MIIKKICSEDIIFSFLDKKFEFKKEKGKKMSNMIIRTEEIAFINPHNINIDKVPYRRPISPTRYNEKYKQLSMDGWWLHKPAVLNPKYEAIDGSHRTLAARNLKIKEVPFVIEDKGNYIEEAKFCIRLNKDNPAFSIIDELWAWKCAKRPEALFLYDINEDEESLFKGKLNLCNSTNDKTFSIAKILDIIPGSIGKPIVNNYNWVKKSRILEIILENIEYHKLRFHSNNFYEFFVRICGEKSRTNSVPYTTSFLVGFLNFYTQLLGEGLLNETTTKKMEGIRSKLNGPEYFKQHKDLVYIQLRKYYNAYKTKTKLEMLEF